MSPQNSQVEVPPTPSIPWNVTVLGNRAFKGVNKVKRGHVVGPSPSRTDVTVRRDTLGMHACGGKAMGGHQQATENGSWRNQRGQHPDLGLANPRTVGKSMPVVYLDHAVRSILLWQPELIWTWLAVFADTGGRGHTVASSSWQQSLPGLTCGHGAQWLLAATFTFHTERDVVSKPAPERRWMTFQHVPLPAPHLAPWQWSQWPR